MSDYEDRIAKATGLLDVAKWLADMRMGRCTKDWAANKCIDVLDKLPADIERMMDVMADYAYRRTAKEIKQAGIEELEKP